MPTDNSGAPVDTRVQYYLDEMQIALDSSHPGHILPVLASSRVGIVDVGCGIGQLFVAKAKEIPAPVRCYGFDIDASAIAYANAHWPERAVFAVASAEQLPLPDRSVDFYVSRVALPYTDVPVALAEAARVLVPGGSLWITLHPVSMTVNDLGEAARKLRIKAFAGRAAVLLNGLAFHLFGTTHHLPGIRESWQSRSRMKRELESAFTDIRIETGRHFLIEAARR